VEILIAITVGVIFILGVTAAILPSINSNKQAQKIQTSAALGNELLGNLRVWSDANWNNLLALSTGTAYRYYLNTTSSPFTIATGMESITIASGTAATSSLANGLVGYWPMDEGAGTVARDVSGNGGILNLTASSLLTWQSGKIGSGAINYNASIPTGCAAGPGVESPSIASAIQNLPSGNFSVSMWVYNPNNVMLFHLNTNMVVSGNFAGFYFTPSYVAVANNSGANTGFSFSSPSNTGWHLFTYIFNLSSSSQSMYVDGVSGGLGSLSGTYGTANQLNIGDYSTGCSDAAAGSTFDDVRIYNRALSPAEITQLYNLAQSNVTYTRYFYLSDVYRDSSGNIVTTGGTYDPSSKLATVVYNWSNGSTNSMTTLLARTRNNVFFQTDWSGGQNPSSTVTAPNNQFASSSNIKYTNSGVVTLPLSGY
jgi:hypothetical protein